MHDLPPDLPRLRALETWLFLQLDQVRQAIAAAEKREAERQRGIEARPPAPDWMLEHGLNRDGPPISVHVGGCHMAGKRAKGVPRAATLRALAAAPAEDVDAATARSRLARLLENRASAPEAARPDGGEERPSHDLPDADALLAFQKPSQRRGR